MAVVGEFHIIERASERYSVSLTFLAPKFKDLNVLKKELTSRYGWETRNRYSQDFIATNMKGPADRFSAEHMLTLKVTAIPFQTLLTMLSELAHRFEIDNLKIENQEYAATFVRALNSINDEIVYRRLMRSTTIMINAPASLLFTSQRISCLEEIDTTGQVTRFIADNTHDLNKHRKILDLVEMAQLIAGLTDLVKQTGAS